MNTTNSYNIYLMVPQGDPETLEKLAPYLLGKSYSSRPASGIVPLQEYLIRDVPYAAVDQAREYLKQMFADAPNRDYVRFQILDKGNIWN